MPDFTQIPGEWPVPGSYTEVSDIPAPGRLTGMPLRCVVIGQTANTATANVLHTNVTAGQAAQLYGAGTSMSVAISTFLTEQPTMSVDAIAVPQPADAKPATGSLAFSGTADTATTAAVLLGGVRVSWSVSAGDSAETIAQALVNAAQASALTTQTGLTVTLGSDKKTVTVTAGEGGALTNAIDLRLSSAVSERIHGVTTTITPMNGGTGTPDISPALLALGETWYTDVILLQNDTAAIEAAVLEARRRDNAMVAKDMRVFVGLRASQGQALALQQSFSTAQELVMLPLQNPRCAPWQIAAALGAQVAQSLNTDPARQLRGLPLDTLAGLGPEHADGFTAAQRAVLLNNGLSTLIINGDGTLALERVVTARVSNPQTGAPSGVWDVMLPAIGARVRFEWNTYVEAHYARAKLADDGSPLAANDGVVTPKTLKSSWIAQCLLYQNQGWIDDVATMGPQANFTRNATDRNRVDTLLPIKPMGSLMVLANALQMQV